MSIVFASEINDIFVVYSTKVFASQPKKDNRRRALLEAYFQGISAAFGMPLCDVEAHQRERDQSCWVASAAPSAMACILAHAMSGYTRFPYPQSVPAMIFSRPMMLA